LNGRKNFKSNHGAVKDFLAHPKSFIFVDKRTGTQRFEVKANADGGMPIDQAVSLLVVQCLLRNQMPNDFRVMVTSDENLLTGIQERAGKLIHACSVTQPSIRLTARQQEVLREVLQSLSNKEIGRKLNMSERTVKFHVSALLEKFAVVKRIGLMQKAAHLLTAVRVPTEVDTPQLAAGEKHGKDQGLGNARERVVQMNDLERRAGR
jgi:DNA-binding CsgD family transcriptional regulator